MEVHASKKSVEGLQNFFFVVPDYQREYVWDKEKNVQRFLLDIYDEFNPNAKPSKQSNYFIGSTIIVKREDGFYDVIDGQQRLTTIIILLCGFRKKLGELDASKLEESEVESRENYLDIIKDLLYKANAAVGKKTPRLTLQYEESKNWLTMLIEKKGFADKTTASIQKMQGAYETILDFLEEVGKDNPQTLVNFARYFLTNVELVIIEPGDMGSALKIFETINERGVGLNAMDLLKNLLFRKSDETEFNSIKTIWQTIIKNLEPAGEHQTPLRFLRYFLMARYHDGLIREDQIYKWIIGEEGKRRIKYEQKAKSFAQELCDAAAIYQKYILATGKWGTDEKHPSISGIGFLLKKTSRQHLVLLLALPDKIGDEAVNLLARNIETLAFYYAMNRVLTKSYEEKFANWAVKLRTAQTVEDVRTWILKELKPEVEKQRNTFTANFSSKGQGDMNPQYRIKYVLGKIENFIRLSSNLPEHNASHFQSCELEHIYPQSPRNVPAESFPNNLYFITVFRLGNLTLLESPLNKVINQANDLSGSGWFNSKLNAYQKSELYLNKSFAGLSIGTNSAYNRFSENYLTSFSDWSSEKVANRQEMLKKMILEIWKVSI